MGDQGERGGKPSFKWMTIIKDIKNTNMVCEAYVYRAGNKWCYDDVLYKYKEVILKSTECIDFNIICRDLVDDIDLSFIGHLILMKMKSKKISIKLVLPINACERKEEINSAVWKLKQSMVHAYYTAGIDIFKIIDYDGKVISADAKKIEWFVLSEKFMPIIFLNEDNYYRAFENYDIKLKNNNRVFGVGEVYKIGLSEEALYQYCRRSLFELVNENNYLDILSTLAFYRSLKDVRLLRKYIYSRIYRYSYECDRIGSVRDRHLISDYCERVLVVFDEMRYMPGIYSLIFSVLTSTNLINSKITNTDIGPESDKIIKLWGFTKELVFGINELAKNIIQHSTTKEGVLSGFIDEKRELQFNVLDYGERGVLSTLKERTKSLKEKERGGGVYTDDYEKMNSHEFNIGDLFEINSSSFLNQQSKRTTAHLGLMIFRKLIVENKGWFWVVSCGEKNGMDEYRYGFDADYMEGRMSIGTNYHLCLRTDVEKDECYRNIMLPEFQNIENALNVGELLQYASEDEYDYKNHGRIIDIRIDFGVINNESDLWEAFVCDLNIKIKKYAIGGDISDFIISIGFKDLDGKLDGSKLFRFLGKWEAEYPLVDLIVYNIPLDIYIELIKINRIFVSSARKGSMPFWNDSSVVVIYSYLKLDEDRVVYFADAIWGKTEGEFRLINSIINKNNYNVISYDYNDMDFSLNSDVCVDNKMFYKGKSLLPFDLLIKVNGESIFEINMKRLLCSELRDVEAIKSKTNNVKLNIINALNFQSGFKISNSHFKLGSKIHISDFYYAKRMFQNSFYSSKFAFIVTRYILKECFVDGKYNDGDIDGMTLIGYGMYSELILSIIVKYLDLYFKANGLKIDVNHRIFSDNDELRLMKDSVKMNDNYIIIVPISTTFSTSIKIEEKIGQQFSGNNEKKNMCSHINILEVSNGNIDDWGRYDENSVEAKYGWIEHDKKEKAVTVASYYDDKLKKQKYFISLPSKWYPVESCVKCYPQDINKNCIDKICDGLLCENHFVEGDCPLMEKPLYETDKVSFTTPSLIFGFPRSRNKLERDKKRKVVLTNDSLQWGHLKRNNNHFNINIRDEVFLYENITRVKDWLIEMSVSVKEEDKIDVKSSENVLIVAPKHFSNTVFVNLVNEVLFSNSANILHFDFNNSSIDNFKVFYESTISDADVIIFVDDAIITGSTFIKSSDYLKLIRDGERGGFDYAIFLINRMDYYANQNVMKRLPLGQRLHSYANFNLPSFTSSDNACRLCQEREKALKMLDESFHVRLKHLYQSRIKMLNLKDISDGYSEDELNDRPFENTNEYLMLVETVHRLFQYFNKIENVDKFNKEKRFEAWVKDFIGATESPYDYSYIELDGNIEYDSFPMDIILRAFAYPPLDTYKPIREKVFYWTIDSLNNKIESIKKKRYVKIKYSEFRELKFLIRRTCLVGSNYLISNRFIGFLAELYESGCLGDIRKNAEAENEEYKTFGDGSIFIKLVNDNKSIINNINDFTDYVVSQIKELLYQNESKCIVLEKVILRYQNDSKGYGVEFLQFLRIMRIENGVIIKRFWDYYQKQVSIKLSNQLPFNKQYQYYSLSELFSLTKEWPLENNYIFNKYLEINEYLIKDKRDGKEYEPLEVMTVRICDLLYDMVFDDEDHDGDGAFMLINYDANNSRRAGFENTFVPYNKGYAAANVSNSWYEENNYIISFIDGQKNFDNDYYVTIDLIEKNDDGWESQYKPLGSSKIKIDYLRRCDNVKYVLIMRLSVKQLDENARMDVLSQGVMVFYTRKNCFSLIKTRYLMLLRDGIAKFINKHHKNNEFRDWREKSQQLEFVTSVIHDSNIYKTIFDKICEGVEDPEIRSSLEIVGVLMLNKLFIIKFIKDYGEYGSVKDAMNRNAVITEEYSFAEIESKLHKYAKIIFTFEHGKYNIIPEAVYSMSVTPVGCSSVKVWSMIFDDIIFEIIFNIRKVFGDYIGEYLNKENKLKIDIRISSSVIEISNSGAGLLGLTSESVRELKDRIRDRYKVKGLNLINSLSEILYQSKIDIICVGDFIKISIPLA